MRCATAARRMQCMEDRRASSWIVCCNNPQQSSLERTLVVEYKNDMHTLSVCSGRWSSRDHLLTPTFSEPRCPSPIHNVTCNVTYPEDVPKIVTIPLTCVLI